MEPIVASTNNAGLVGKLFVTVKLPQDWSDAEPETLSYQRAVVEEVEVSTDVVMSGWVLAVIVAVKQGLT